MEFARCVHFNNLIGFWQQPDSRVALNFYEVLELDKISRCGPPFWSHVFMIFSNGLLPILNSTLNFFIYFFAGKKFRQSLFNMITCKKEDRLTGVVSKTSFRWVLFKKANFVCIV